MGRHNRLRLHRNLWIDRHDAWSRAAGNIIRIAICFLLLLTLVEHALGQGDFESHLADAVKAQSAGNVPGAITAYQQALTIRRDVPEVWANLGLMQHQAGDHSGALESFSAASRLQPKLFVPLLFLGIENLQLGNKAEAVRYLSIAQQLHPNDREVYLNLGSAYFGLKQFENASIAYRRATELDANDGELWYRLGITYLEMSEQAAGDFVQLNQQSPYFQRLNAESLSAQDKLPQSMEVFNKLLSGSTFPPCTRSSFGLVLVKNGKAPEARTEFEHDLKIGGCSLAELGIIRLELAQGESETALKSLATLWALDPGFIRANASELGRAMSSEQNRAFDEVLATARTSDVPPEEILVLRTSLRGGRTLSVKKDSSQKVSAKTFSPAHSQSLYARGEYAKCSRNLLPGISALSSQRLSMLAACAFYTGDYENALTAAKKLRASPLTADEGLYWSILAQQRLALLALAYAGEVEPNSIRLHELLAESYRDRERYADAEAEYQVALSLNPQEFAALVGAATNYLQELKVDLAREMIQQALAQRPSDAEANYIMGEVLISQHKLSESEPYLRAGLSARAELVPRIHALLGLIYTSQGDTKRAIEEYKLGLSSDDDGSVHFQLGRLYQKIGEKELAENAFADSKVLNQRKRSNAIDAFGVR